MAKQAAKAGDDGTNDLLVSNLIRTNELQVWFLAEHLVDVPVVRARSKDGNNSWRPTIALPKAGTPRMLAQIPENDLCW